MSQLRLSFHKHCHQNHQACYFSKKKLPDAKKEIIERERVRREPEGVTVEWQGSSKGQRT